MRALAMLTGLVLAVVLGMALAVALQGGDLGAQPHVIVQVKPYLPLARPTPRAEQPSETQGQSGPAAPMPGINPASSRPPAEATAAIPLAPTAAAPSAPAPGQPAAAPAARVSGSQPPLSMPGLAIDTAPAGLPTAPPQRPRAQPRAGQAPVDTTPPVNPR